MVAAAHSYDAAANWKILSENYHECYHCPTIHPELCSVSPPHSGENYDSSGAWIGGWMELRDGAATMSLDGHSDGVPLRGLSGDGLRTVIYVGIFPNVLLSLHPDYVMTHVLVPAAADRTRHRVLVGVRARGRERARVRPGVRGRLLGPDQPAGLDGVRVRAARPRVAVRLARAAVPG